MWILTASFDGAEISDGNANLQKSKLLKPGKTYALGRRDQPLVIKHQRISKEHGVFEVSSVAEDRLSDPDYRPSLRYINKRDNKSIKVIRGQGHILIDNLSSDELQHGDVLWPIIQEKIDVKWEPLCCYYPPEKNKVASLVRGCTSLGISLVHTPEPWVTHHLTSSYAASASVGASLLSASQFVRPEWLEEIIRLGTTEQDSSDQSALENAFALPPLSKYRPSFSPKLHDSQKVFKVWEPNEERMNMLNNYRFFLVSEIPYATGSDAKDLIQRGGGTYEVLNIHAGKTKWHRALVRGNAKEGQKLVLVGNKDSLKAAIDEHDWQDLIHEVEIFDLPFIAPDALIQAVINIDTSGLDKSSEQGEGIQVHHKPPFKSNHEKEVVPVTPPEPQQDRSRGLVRSVTSRKTSVEPIESALPEDNKPRLRRALTRRTNAKSGLEDLSGVRNTQPEAMPIDLTASIPVRSRQLKRRRNASEPVQSSDILHTSPNVKLQSAKRHKTLYEDDKIQDMNVDEMYSQLPVSLPTEASSETLSQTQTQRNFSGPVQAPLLRPLPVVHEEEEETQGTSNTSRGIKRKAEVIYDVEMDIAISKKKKTLGETNAAEEQPRTTVQGTSSKPPSSAKMDTNKLDVDTAFLKAVASTKKGKKKEDDFDRDFNKLKIARPELERQEEDWDVVDDFGNDTGIRGNFMVILEMDVPTKDHAQHRTVEMWTDWQDVPNFKKFKKVCNVLYIYPNIVANDKY
ncbi:hypothetical protein AX15_000986 [Amanita polypyramis BW_CC]|nr:hypothetical protein AX15_000986 [Amanita polypyramis BW_CC]